jgi:hypothetical protein
VPEPRAFEVEMAIEKLKSHKSPFIDRIPAELIKAGGGRIRYEIHKLNYSIWNKEELPDEWKESIIVPCYKKGHKTDCSNNRGISLLPTMYKILSNVLLSKLTPYAEEIFVDYQCGFRRSRSSSVHIFCICQILEEKWVYKETVHQLFVDFKKAYDAFRKEFGIPMKLVMVIKMCLNETCSRIQIGNHLSDMKITLFWVITQRVVIISYRCCETTYQSRLFLDS